LNHEKLYKKFDAFLFFYVQLKKNEQKKECSKSGVKKKKILPFCFYQKIKTKKKRYRKNKKKYRILEM